MNMKIKLITPAAVYENAKLCKEHILQENQGKAGVYR
jgi:hypothetical protein